MQRLRVIPVIFGVALAGATTSGGAQLLPQTWVASGGTDLNPCTRLAPCESFAGALAKTSPGGEIHAVDPGSYGPVIIDKSVTIDGGVLGAISPAGGDAVVVNAGSADVVVLRNLEINSGGVGGNGIRFSSGKRLVIDNVRVIGFGGRAIWVPVPASPGSVAENLVITNSLITSQLADIGVDARQGIVTISNSVIAGNAGIGLLAGQNGIINADSNILTNNGVALRAGAIGVDTPIIRISNNDVYGNLTGFGCGNGSLLSAGNNRKGNNTGGTNPSCAPTGAINQQ